jgi:adenosylmethionine-8-amino-7-oxononanoate aminotransferase
MIRITADTIALSPPLIISEAEIDELFARLKALIVQLAK